MADDRCHLYLPLVDSSGTIYPYSQVTLLDPATNLPLAAPVYPDPSSLSPVTFPVFTAPAIIDLWTDAPVRVNIVAVMSQDVTVTMFGVDIAPAPSSAVRADEYIRLASPEDLPSSAVLVAGQSGSASWQVTDLFTYHSHQGAAPGSTVVGTLSPSDWKSMEVWIGAGITGGDTSGAGEIGIGLNAAPTGEVSVAVGGAALAGDQGVAVGSSAQAAAGSVVLGASATSSAARQALLGAGVSATGVEAVVAGAGASGQTLALGTHVRTDSSGNLLIGSGAVPDTTGWVGPFVHLLGNTVVPWYLAAPGDAMLAGAASTLGCYGTTGASRAFVDPTGTTGALASLLTALGGLGLIRIS